MYTKASLWSLSFPPMGDLLSLSQQAGAWRNTGCRDFALTSQGWLRICIARRPNVMCFKEVLGIILHGLTEVA
jgi:hypothetical protein